MNNGIFPFSNPSTPAEAIIKIKPASTTKTLDTVLALDPDLQAPIVGGLKYSGRFTLFFTGSGTTEDLKLTLTPASIGYYGTPTDFNGIAVASSPPALAATGVNNTFGSINGVFGIQIMFALFPSSSGTFGLEWAQNTSSAQILILLPGSMMELYKY